MRKWRGRRRELRHFLYLLLAIVSEVIATSSLKASQGFSRLWPSLLVVVGYGPPFTCFPQPEKIPLGIAYAIWSGLGTVGGRFDRPVFMGRNAQRPAGFRDCADPDRHGDFSILSKAEG